MYEENLCQEFLYWKYSRKKFDCFFIFSLICKFNNSQSQRRQPAVVRAARTWAFHKKGVSCQAASSAANKKKAGRGATDKTRQSISLFSVDDAAELMMIMTTINNIFVKKEFSLFRLFISSFSYFMFFFLLLLFLISLILFTSKTYHKFSLIFCWLWGITSYSLVYLTQCSSLNAIIIIYISGLNNKVFKVTNKHL